MNFENATNPVETAPAEKETSKETVETKEDLTKNLAEEHKMSEKDQKETQEGLKDVRDSLGSEKSAAEKKAEAESSERRNAYIKAGVKLITDSMEATLNKGIFGRSFVSKSEIKNDIEKIKHKGEMLVNDVDEGPDAEKLDSVNWKVFLAAFNSSANKGDLLPQLEALKSEYLKSEDLDRIDTKKKQMEDQLTSDSMGVSGDRVQF